MTQRLDIDLLGRPVVERQPQRMRATRCDSRMHRIIPPLLLFSSLATFDNTIVPASDPF